MGELGPQAVSRRNVPPSLAAKLLGRGRLPAALGEVSVRIASAIVGRGEAAQRAEFPQKPHDRQGGLLERGLGSLCGSSFESRGGRWWEGRGSPEMGSETLPIQPHFGRRFARSSSRDS